MECQVFTTNMAQERHRRSSSTAYTLLQLLHTRWNDYL